jgi:hypothetical protein
MTEEINTKDRFIHIFLLSGRILVLPNPNYKGQK